MDYNTNREKLLLPEYGRHVQKMVNIIKSTPSRDDRNKLTQSTIQLMGNLNPQLHDAADYKHKLWDHLAAIADYDIDIDAPYQLPTKAEAQLKPSKMLYSNPDEIRFKHYGKLLEDMVRKATQYPEGEEKNALIEVLANQMKKSFLTWNRETVADDVIFADMLAISCNHLTIPEGLKLKDAHELLKVQAAPTPQQQQNKKKKNKKKMQQRKQK